MSDERDIRSDAVLVSLDVEPGPMPNLSEPAAQALTWRVVERWSSARAAGSAGAKASDVLAPLSAASARKLVQTVLRRYARQKWLQALAAAGFVLSLTGLAFGALHIWGPLASPAPTSESTAERIAATRQRAPKKRSPPQVPPPTAPATLVPSPVTPSDGASSDGMPSASAAGDGTPSEVAPIAVSAAVPSLDSANALRAERAWQPAKRLYMRIAEEAAEPRERYVAAVAAAALCVQHTGEPQRALGLYATALAAWPEGDLSEEIRLGIAHAQRALERPKAETAALRDFLAHHAASADADAARQRLAQLTETQPDAPRPRAAQ